MAPAACSYEVYGPVGFVTINNPPVNSLSPEVVAGLKRCMEELRDNDEVLGVVIGGSHNIFCGGFAIDVLAKLQNGPEHEVDAAMRSGALSSGGVVVDDLIENSRKPVVAAIQGMALGGGLEVALACHARVVAKGTKLGLPELSLGIIPGLGGTQRLPRLVGVAKSLEMMLTSKPVGSGEALELGLADAEVPPAQVWAAAKDLVLAMAGGQKPIRRTLHLVDKLGDVEGELQMVNFAKAQAVKKMPQVRHPGVCCDVVAYGLKEGGVRGLALEHERFVELVFENPSKALVHFFFAQRNTRNVDGVTNVGLKPRKMNTVAVLGGGLMGSGIATALISAGCNVLLKEINSKFLKAGMERVDANLQSKVRKGKLSQQKKEAMMSRVQGTLDYSKFGKCDMVIEAVIENVGLKQQIFADLEKYCNHNCILATNTSTIDIEVVGSKTRAQDRIVGAHFFSPAHVMPLLEIIRAKQSSPQVVLDLLTLGKRIKKTPVVVGNCCGFAVNRVFFPYGMSAGFLLDLGQDILQIDKAIKAFGMPMGPFMLNDLVGMGTAFHVASEFKTHYPDRVYSLSLVKDLLDAKRLGQATKRGFYKYDEKGKPSPDSSLEPFIARSRRNAGIYRKGLKMSDQELVEMIFFPVVNEACRVVSEGIVDKASDLDVATVMSMGFPAYRGGIVKWADSIGAGYILSRLRSWQTRFPESGGLYAPSAYLEACASKGVPIAGAREAQRAAKL
mmetsp:Transcript_9223/g.33812  ORF Transcript_9223/g.33812 Transcript_9223/m.33812 type:complete len:730 (+) Transcript_9223:121-2310(+)